MLQIDEKYIEQYIEQTKEKQKNTNQANCADFSFSKMLEYRHIPIDNIEIYIEFKDKFCNICKNFVFDFVGNIKLLSVKNVIYSNTSFANLKSKQIIFNNCDIQWLKLGDSIECDNIIFTNCKINSISFINPSSHYRFKDACFKFYHCSIDNILIANGLWHKVEFCKEISFVGCRFLNDKNGISLSNYIFGKKANFSNCKFYTDVYFNNSTFQDSADFRECEFEKTAGFYGTTFEKVPNFSQAIFKGNLNLVNTNLNFDFEDVEKKIKEEYSNHIGTEKEKFLDKFANDFRDSFRLFKNALIKENNLLDAANHHRIELYCKEIELESKKPKIFSRDWIDKWILKFYRHTSDHHTDLLKIWHSLLIVVGIFGILSSGVIVAFDYGYLKFCDFSAHSLIEMYNAHINHFVLTHSYEMLGMNALLFMLFIGLFMLGVLWDRARVIGICISYCVTILLFAASPKYLIPAIGIFTDKRSMLDPLSVIGGIYTIVFAFMLYSFIKTARKNSIIPH